MLDGERDGEERKEQKTLGPGKDREAGPDARPRPAAGEGDVERQEQEEEKKGNFRAGDRGEGEVRDEREAERKGETRTSVADP